MVKEIIMTSKIEWTDETYNPVVGCTKISSGCENCYAERMAKRLAGMSRAKRRGGEDPGKLAYYEQAEGWDGPVIVPEALEEPLHWRKPRHVFVCSMSDLFHEDVPFWFLRNVFDTMAMSPRHTYQVLTKRPDRMLEFLSREWPIHVRQERDLGIHEYVDDVRKKLNEILPNVWLGVTIENQQCADERRDSFEATPAAVKFVSHGPALGNVNWDDWEFIDQLITEGESGPGARPMHPDWARNDRDWCQDNGVAFFFKQWGAWGPDTKVWKRGIPTHQFDTGRDVLQRYIPVYRAGKKANGRLLDGREWNEMPESHSTSF
jgi:protein gp37